MKKSKEIIGAPVISISEGIQIGSVKGLVVNPQQKNVEFLLLDELQEGKELKGLSFRSAEGVGEFAVTVQNSNVIVDLMKISLLKELVQKGIQVLGTKVVTRKGKFWERGYRILCRYGKRRIDRSSFITFQGRKSNPCRLFQ